MFNTYKEDIAAFRAHDPAATSTVSIVLNSPGMRAIWAYRRQHWLWTHGHPLLARTLSTRSRRKFGVEIHPAATIGRRFLIDHGMGIVIGETCVIGDDCMIYQGVTLGGTGKQSGKRHPTLENNVTVGVGASVLGNITLHEGAKVGGGAVVVKDVPAYCTVVGVPGHIATQCGTRVRSRDTAGSGVTLDASTRASEQALNAKISAREDATHRQFLPDPLDQTIQILTARITQLEARLAQLEPATSGAAAVAGDAENSREVAAATCDNAAAPGAGTAPGAGIAPGAGTVTPSSAPAAPAAQDPAHSQALLGRKN
jgi:serine O-acetyltransferase